MLWISVLLPHLPVDLREPAPSRALAVTAGIGPHRCLLACNAAARSAGMTAGMDVPAALMREPALELIQRSKADERRALHGLACWAHQFTSDVCLDLARWTLWLEAGASLRYFNGLHTLHAQLKEGLTRLGYTASIGVGPTLEAAAVLSRHRDVLPALNFRELRRVLAPLPLSSLLLQRAVLEQLQTSGLRTIGDLLGVAQASIGRRFGVELTHYLQRLLGERPDPRRRHRMPPLYRRRLDFAQPLEVLEGLLFPLRRLLQEFQGYLRGRDVAVQRLTVTLQHRNSPDTTLQLLTSAPQRDAQRLFALLREKLERTALPQAITRIILTAQDFVAPQIIQGDFFDDHARRDDSWTALLDKLRARLGPDAVRRLGLRDDHRPENAWCIAAEDQADLTAACNHPADGPSAACLPDRPLWLLQPTPLASLPLLLGTPERIEAGWWEGEDASRDYYLARTAEGARWWLYREVGTKRWFLQGLWA